MDQPRQPFENQKFNLLWEKLQIRKQNKVIFYYPSKNNQNQVQKSNMGEYEKIISQTHKYNELSEELFWGNQSDTIDVLIFNQDIDDNPEIAFKMLAKNHVISYYYNVRLSFEELFFKHVQIILISPKNNIIYNFENKKIISTYSSPYLQKLVNIFIKDQQLRDQYKLEIVKDFYINQFPQVQVKEPYQDLKPQIPECRLVDDKQTIIWLVDRKCLKYYLCFEPNFITYYGQLNKNYQKHGRGILFQTSWNDCNPNYTILQGNFEHGKKNGIMMKFSSRSQTLLHGLEYLDDEFKKQLDLDENGKIKVPEIVKVETQDKKIPKLPKRRIVIMEDGVIINNKDITENDRQRTQKSDTFVKFNQQFNSNDANILQSRDQWLNSSIIDGFALVLYKKHYKQAYKSIDPIKNLNTFVIDSTYLTSAAIDYKLVTSLKALCFEFKGITIFDVYNNIAFIVNSNNSHWYLVLVKREKQQGVYQMKFHILDSMLGPRKKYKHVCEKIFNLLKFHLDLEDNYRFGSENNIIVEDVQQQKDGSSCGDHTCFFLYQIFNGKNYKEKNIKQIGEMRGMIYNLIFGQK
ncbi:unnamed protein product (macronuclear) [Paramecium tetraurelia]|uniref:Ubiquitin-like protease family profile domain-containing protein n=1 Tax=Paramecium tetraurelia TaxID=5888 RepID=A0EFM3_PARTE|nr:uncharacterized protein GSPATT00026437001 [Paramecium tetraurelia]CAK94114.1 unnamed protein product [Paramecium tetraurelia]|eukprot:XP_001461487.1 hypothetical protein (macronuclear) [Paramecium tetraurelia strain d4-2]